jgi:hypothetical protein
LYDPLVEVDNNNPLVAVVEVVVDNILVAAEEVYQHQVVAGDNHQFAVVVVGLEKMCFYLDWLIHS